MQHPDQHLDVVHARHSDLLRQARNGELAARLAVARREERRWLRLRRSENGPSASAAPAR
ncbi:MAG: hypothetical protein ACRDNI_12405 [Gaiellaceae bacterium]